MIEIKTKLKETYQLLKKSKLNGKYVYEELKAEGAEDLPAPMGGTVKEKPRPISNKMSSSEISRPKTATNFFLTQTNTQTNFKSPGSTGTGFYRSQALSASTQNLKVKQIISPKDKDFDQISLLDSPTGTNYITMLPRIENFGSANGDVISGFLNKLLVEPTSR